MISAAIAAIGLATLTANAGSNTHTGSQGSVVSLVAGTRAIVKADRDEVALGTRSVPASTRPAARAVAAGRPAAPGFALSAGCQAAINTLKALHQADGAEDLAEAQKWRNALTAARTACLPAPSAACQAAITNLQTLLQATRELAGLKAAFAAVATACGHRD